MRGNNDNDDDDDNCETGYAFVYQGSEAEAGKTDLVGYLDEGDHSRRSTGQPTKAYPVGGGKIQNFPLAPSPSTPTPLCPRSPTTSPPGQRYKQAAQCPLPSSAQPALDLLPPPPPLMSLHISPPPPASPSVRPAQPAPTGQHYPLPCHPTVSQRSYLQTQSTSTPKLVSGSPNTARPPDEFHVVATISTPTHRYVTLSRPVSPVDTKGGPRSPVHSRGQVLRLAPPFIPSLAAATRSCFPAEETQ